LQQSQTWTLALAQEASCAVTSYHPLSLVDFLTLKGVRREGFHELSDIVRGVEQGMEVLFHVVSGLLPFRMMLATGTAFALEEGLDVLLFKVTVMDTVVFPRLSALGADDVHDALLSVAGCDGIPVFRFTTL